MKQKFTEILNMDEIYANPIKAFEKYIYALRENDSRFGNSNNSRRYIYQCILALNHLKVEQNSEKEKVLDLLNDKQKRVQDRVLIGWLLRLIQEQNIDWIKDNPFRPIIVALFDVVLEDVYRDRKIDSRLMAHEKIQKLSTIVKSSEESFYEALSMLTSIDRIKEHRHRLMQALGNRIAQHVIVPFLPTEYSAQLGEAYKRVESYLQNRNVLGIIDILENTKIELHQIENLFESKETLYSKAIAENIGSNLLNLIEKDFANNVAAQPANVSIETHDNKKYPFHLIDQNLNMTFIVKNNGPGYSYETKITLASDDSIKITTDEVQVGRLAPATSQIIEIPAKSIRAKSKADFLVQIDWLNFDNTSQCAEFTITAYSQRSDINWEQLEQTDPYSLEPVSTENELVGRRDLFNRLLATLKAKSIGSAIIRGQKRVGKTSLAKSIQSSLQKEGNAVIYIESGDFVDSSPSTTIKRLGDRLCKEIINIDSRFKHITKPNFEDALSPFAEFLDDITKIFPEVRIIFILDEFDELPLDLYLRGAIGDSFFLTLRSISSRPNIGFILVGSEKITHIMDCQGDKLNKWNVVPVDYFTRESDWTDYRELVQRPVGNSLEYTDGALFALHDITAGNPYFTKLVCQRVFRFAINKRDCHITQSEISEAVELALRETDRNTFQHFWEDGIFERGVKATEKSIRRRKVLIALSDVLLSQKPAPRKMIGEHSLTNVIASLDSDLKEFVTRRILIHNVQDNTYDFKVPLFTNWLKGRGIEDVIATFSDLDAALSERQREEEIKVNSDEIQRLIDNWGAYKGQTITIEKVRYWLEQFGGYKEQRLMFTMLKGIRYYSHLYVRHKMAEVHDIIKRGTIHQLQSGKLKRSDILVSYLDNPAKSSAYIARLYVEESSIYIQNVVEKSGLAETLKTNKNTQALVFLDDFIGTGNSAEKYLKEIDNLISDIVLARNIRIVFVAIVAFIDGFKHLEKVIEKLKTPIKLHVCEILDETTKCFSEQSTVFLNSTQRDAAKENTLRIGKYLEKNCPFGYGNLEMLVVFERSCPNNTLPIIWSESTTPKWIPLFKRH